MKANLYFGHDAESCLGTLMTVVRVNLFLLLLEKMRKENLQLVFNVRQLRQKSFLESK